MLSVTNNVLFITIEKIEIFTGKFVFKSRPRTILPDYKGANCLCLFAFFEKPIPLVNYLWLLNFL